MKQIEDFVRDGHAWFKCTGCGAETTILKHMIVPARPGEKVLTLIDMEETLNNITAFTTKHAICKPPHIQKELFDENPN